MKAQEELKVLKEEHENQNKKPYELTEDDLEQVLGGAMNVKYNAPAENELTQLSKNRGSLNKY